MVVPAIEPEPVGAGHARAPVALQVQLPTVNPEGTVFPMVTPAGAVFGPSLSSVTVYVVPEPHV